MEVVVCSVVARQVCQLGALGSRRLDDAQLLQVDALRLLVAGEAGAQRDLVPCNFLRRPVATRANEAATRWCHFPALWIVGAPWKGRYHGVSIASITGDQQ